MSKKLSKALKPGLKVILTTGPKSSRGKGFEVRKVSGDKVYLDGYRVLKRSARLSQKNTQNFISVHHSVHISNVKLDI